MLDKRPMSQIRNPGPGIISGLGVRNSVTGVTSGGENPVGEDGDGARWGMDVFGIIFYLFIEYTRLAVMYPVLAPLQLGKIALMCAVLGALVSHNAGDQSGNQALKTAIILLGAATLMSFVSASYHVPMYKQLWNMPEQLLVALLIARATASRWRQRAVSFVVLLLMLKVAQHGLRTYALEHGRAVNEMAFVRFGIIGGGGGFYDNSADLGVAMCVVFGLSLALFQADLPRKWRAFYCVCMIAFGALILVCGSRGAVVGGVAVVLATWVRSSRKSWSFIFVLLFLLGLIFLMPHASRDRFKSAEDYKTDTTANDRIELWKAGVKMWKASPVLGVGPANFPYERLLHYRIDSVNDRSPHVCHSMYVEVLSELGGLGALISLMVIFNFFWMVRRVRQALKKAGKDSRCWEMCLANGLQLAMIGYLVSGAFVSVFWYPHIWVLSGLAMGLNASVCGQADLDVAAGNRRPIAMPALRGAHGAV